MSERGPVDQPDAGDSTSTGQRQGPGRWLLTWAGIFTMVIVLAVIFAVIIIIFAM